MLITYILFPSTIFMGKNLFLGSYLFFFSELSHTSATLAGNSIPMIRAASDKNQGLINALGKVFTVPNVLCTVTVFYICNVDIKKIESKGVILLSHESSKGWRMSNSCRTSVSSKLRTTLKTPRRGGTLVVTLSKTSQKEVKVAAEMNVAYTPSVGGERNTKCD